MLKEITLEELPAAKAFGQEQSPDGKFAEETVMDFATSDLMIAEVTGFPSGDPTSSKRATRCRSLLESKVKKHKLYNITAMQRGNRVFLQKTIVRKA